MTMAIIAGLAGLLIFIGIRLSMSKSENEQLRQQIASLKRQLRNR